jgi:long-chain acyl-CoA synthetase
MSADGYFKSGDIGIMSEEGEVQIVDRKKDMIVVAGFKVFPNEVEEVISQMPGVRECAVIGIPHRKLGEIVKVFIVKGGMDLTKEQVSQYSKEQLTSYKRPRQIVFVDDLPKSNIGKIMRRHLRDF